MRRGKKYVKFDDLIEYLKALRMNRSMNVSPYMDNALLNIQQLLELDVYNPCIFDVVYIGGCDDCYWKNRYQKCSCCRRNRKLKDCYMGCGGIEMLDEMPLPEAPEEDAK